MPDRITLRRAKGWKLPPNTVVVARPSRWGNPFKVADAREAGYLGSDADLQAMCVDQFRRWLNGSNRCWQGPQSDAARAAILARLPELRGKNLACWCKPGSSCHADVLLEIANGPYPDDGWLIHKAGRGWYRPDAWGYTLNPSEAGRFSRAAALRHSHPNGPNGPRDGMTIRHESEIANA